VLNGAFLFMADLVRAIDLPLTLDFISVSSYGSRTESSGEVRLVKDLDQSLKGKHVVLVEDIVDTGLTMRYLRQYLEGRARCRCEGGGAAEQAVAPRRRRRRSTTSASRSRTPSCTATVSTSTTATATSPSSPAWPAASPG
jgi:hypothetical protein